MELSLKYNEHATHALNAAFVRGNKPAAWLQEMNVWQIPLNDLVCYIVSQNNNPHEAAGLFVIFSKGKIPSILQVKQPYTALAGKLYIPVDAALIPAVSEYELQSLLMWDCQVFHPTIGFIGFETSDRVSLVDLIEYTTPQNVNWEYANAGNDPWIPLHQINIQRLSVEEIFDAVQESINSKPLTDIPASNKKDVPGWLNNPLSEALLKFTFSLIKGLGSLGSIAGMIAGGRTGNGSANYSADDGRPGLFGRIMNWMQERIEDLEKQRDSELKRLSEMFEKNVDEFLQYAIPLSSPYMNRGAATPSARLQRNPLQFNPGRLGGGRAVDGWNLDNYYDELRRKYLDAAQQAIAKKDFKKAAYVYAHLLGDYPAAANTLKQGKHYREAAALYKEHLGNLHEAALCYEEGGLYEEAIQLYTDTGQHEKAGDLHMQLEQKERALACYENSLKSLAANKDYLEQSRIINDKIGDRPRAKKVLLEGWQDVKQPEACLGKYFDLLAGDNKEQLHEEVKAFYHRKYQVNRKLSFLNVIEGVNKKYQTKELESTCRNIAYEVVSEEVSKGNRVSLHQLRDFIKDDQLLAPDCYRFIHTSKHVPEQKPVSSNVRLMKDVVWIKMLRWKDQILAWGIKSGELLLARINTDGYVEYFNWGAKLGEYHVITPLADAENTNEIILYNQDVNYAEKWLTQNKYFQHQLHVFKPSFFHYNVVGACIHEGEIFTLHPDREEAFLNRYTLTGELRESIRCKYERDLKVPKADTNEMVFSNGCFYLACENMVLRISALGEIELLYSIEGLVHKVVVYKLPDGDIITIGLSTGGSAIFIRTRGNDPVEDPFEIKGDFSLITDIAILPGNRYVVAQEKKVQMYYDMEDNSSPELYWEMTIEDKVAAVFPGHERNQLGILEANGQISFHVIN